MISNSRKKQKSDFPDSFFSSPMVKIFSLIIIVFLIVADINVYKDREKINSQVASFKGKIQGMQNQNNILEQGIANANDKDYIEKIAREQLDLQKSNEKVVTFIMPETKQKPPATNNNFFDIKIWLSWLSNDWQWIKSKF